MNATRWTLILLAALAAAAVSLYATRGPAASAPALGTEPAVATLPLTLPPAASAAQAVPSSATQPTTPVRAATTAPPPPRIGSEGYGPHIERAKAGNDAAAAWEAVQWLQQCASNEARRQSFELVRNQGISPEMMTQLMQEADAEARRCQTVTAQHQAMLPELALQAMRGGVPQAAAGFAGSVDPASITPALRQEVLATLRRDADSGHPGSLFGALLAPGGWELSDAEKLAYLVAYGAMTGKQGQGMTQQLVAQRTIRFKAEPTPLQQAAALVEGQRIVERARAAKTP